jgi:hypothetical protein
MLKRAHRKTFTLKVLRAVDMNTSGADISFIKLFQQTKQALWLSGMQENYTASASKSNPGFCK